MGEEENVEQEGELQEAEESGETDGQEGEGQAEEDIGDEEQEEESPAPQKGDLARKLKDYEQQLEYFRGMLRSQEQTIDLLKKQGEAVQQREEDPFESLDPDEPITAKHIGLLEKKIKTDYERKLEAVEGQRRRQVALMSEKAARQAYTDYDEVLKFTADLAKQNPSIIQRIALSDDPAEEAYRQGLVHPEYLAKIRTGQKREVLKKVASNLKKPRQSLVGGKQQGTGEKNPIDMNPEEFAAYRRRKVGV